MQAWVILNNVKMLRKNVFIKQNRKKSVMTNWVLEPPGHNKSQGSLISEWPGRKKHI